MMSPDAVTAAPEWEARADAGVDELGQGLQDLEADAGIALQQGIDAHEHGRA
jgi:hypothetical protein